MFVLNQLDLNLLWRVIYRLSSENSVKLLEQLVACIGSTMDNCVVVLEVDLNVLLFKEL